MMQSISWPLECTLLAMNVVDRHLSVVSPVKMRLSTAGHRKVMGIGAWEQEQDPCRNSVHEE